MAGSGAKNSRFKGGWTVDASGYVRVLVGRDHPLANSRGYCYAHILIWTAAHGPIPEGCQVHHKNEVKKDNRIENLELKHEVPHASDHASEKPRDPVGRFLPREQLDGYDDDPPF